MRTLTDCCAEPAYLTGVTYSINFPVTPGAFQTVCNGGPSCVNYGDAFVTKVNPTGSALVYSTFLGGTFEDYARGIAVDGSGDAYVTGATFGFNFPTMHPLQPQYRGNGDAFVTEVNPAGSSLVYSTFLGGAETEQGNSIAVDGAGNAYVTGFTQSTNFPLANPFQNKNGGRYGAFVSRINAAGSTLFSSTYLGGSAVDYGNSIALDSAGNAYVTGGTGSTDFPVTPGAFQTTCGNPNPCGNAFVTKIRMTAATTTTLSSSPNPSTYGQSVTFTGVVTSNAGAPPDGELVTFKKGTTVLGTGTLSGGSASFTTSTLPVGTDYIKAVYSGDSNFAASTSKAVSQVVNKATTTTTLTSSLNPSNFGQSVTFTASVAPQFSGAVKGSVTFYDGTAALKTVGLSGGVAKFTTSTLASGTHSITATYNGSSSFGGSSASLTQTVN